MSQYDYQVSKTIAAQDHPFHALIMAAMRQADTNNADLLRAIFPETWHELKARYHAPGGVLPGEPGGIDEARAQTNNANEQGASIVRTDDSSGHHREGQGGGQA